jgi:predicted secreted protein
MLDYLERYSMKAKRNVNFDVSATREIENDVLTLRYSTTRIGADPNTLQTELIEAVNKTFSILRESQSPLEAEFDDDSFQCVEEGLNVSPVYNKKGVIDSYRGIANIVIFGTDTAAVTSAGSKITELTISSMSNSVSRATREMNEDELIEEAIHQFKERAHLIADAFDFGSFDIENVNVDVRDYGSNAPKGGARMMSISASLEAAAPEIEAPSGKSNLTATARGTIVLKP